VINELCNTGGARQEGSADQMSIRVSREDRKMAGMTDKGSGRLIKAASTGGAYSMGNK
jgi:hypothetical protein